MPRMPTIDNNLPKIVTRVDGLDSLERLVISRVMLVEIEHYCVSDPLVETCGLIGGMGEIAHTFYPTKNIANDPQHGYLVDPEDQISAFRTMAQRREEMLGIVHSHPNSGAQPSATDLAQAAYPGVAYLIVSLRDDAVLSEAYLFTGRNFEKLALEVVDLPKC